MNNLRIVYFIKAIFWINNFKLLYDSYIVIVIYFKKNNKIVNKLHINIHISIFLIKFSVVLKLLNMSFLSKNIFNLKLTQIQDVIRFYSIFI